MSCLSVIIERLSKSLDVIVERIGGIAVNISYNITPIKVTSADIGEHLKIISTDIGEHLKIVSTDVGAHLNVSCGIICDVGDLPMLRVSPEEVQWITPDMGIVYNVVSNTTWNIE